MNKNIAIIVFDCLRYDTAKMANTPNLKALFNKYDKFWVKAYANGTYTLPSHIALFKSGHLPSNNIDVVPSEYKRTSTNRVFNATLNWTRNRKAMFPTPDAPNIVKGFELMGYRTIGIGGVHWFNTNFETSNFWKGEYFKEFYWEEAFAEDCKNNIEQQVNLASSLLKDEKGPVFFFLNVATMHRPCRGDSTLKGQVAAFNYVDSFIPKLVELLPKPCFTIFMADHGTLFGEDGLTGHGFFHRKIIEVPICMLELV